MLQSKSNIFTDFSGTSLAYVSGKVHETPANALNHRVSAHYTEINQMYAAEMLKKVSQIYKCSSLLWKIT